MVVCGYGNGEAGGSVAKENTCVAYVSNDDGRGGCGVPERSGRWGGDEDNGRC